jgi:transcriptional regulator with XRE-family HTH domain
MPRIKSTAEALPAKVTHSVEALGGNIRTARIRRRITQRDLARRAGISRVAMARVERGRPTTSIAAYLAALWALGLEREFEDLGSPDRDDEGKTLERARQPKHARRPGGLDADF